ncbi:zinc finger protein hangover-like isoform X2 [Toxorhynchites rutilus septentrionalis]|nr:zinc finger protein hangover-like isoform X2 [Toxorhynchites rutilus septentrionalis]
MELDPSQFLLQSQNDDDYDEQKSIDRDSSINLSMKHEPLILASLGLHHINSTDLFENISDNENEDEDNQKQSLASCSVCDMTFSNRANARRHERNIHGLRQNPSNPLLAQGYEDGLQTSSNNDTATLSMPTAMPNIDLQQKYKVKLKTKGETYDYDNPAKYRHLVTPNRLAFILRNLDFLKQAQHMKCNCCNKTYPSYKYFMGHMRKKYPNLPRNVCFKCLRQFSSKGQFIGHLKRKNCINLYAIVMADDGISKVPIENVSLAIPGSEEVIFNKNYGCKICKKEFKPKIDLRQHVLDAHSEIPNNQKFSNPVCVFCTETFDDLVLRQKHYINLDCTMFIVCSCGKHFDDYTAYVDHVYQQHVPPQLIGQDEYGYELFDQDGNSSSHLRNPQNCPVCNKQYNNYYNVLRHMESKHPNQLPQIYQCTLCSEGFPRQSELRDHLHRTHGETEHRQRRQSLSQHHPPFMGDKVKTSFVCKECGQTFAKLLEWINHQGEDHLRFNCNKCDLQTDDKEAFVNHCSSEHQNFIPGVPKVQFYSCRQCSSTYSSIDNLQKHLQTDHIIDSGGPHDENVRNGAESEPDTHLTLSDDLNKTVSSVLKCGLCAFVLTDIDALRNHMGEVHGMDKKFFYCNHCNAKFMNDKGLRVHLFRLHGIRDETIPLNAGPSLLKSVQPTSGQQTNSPSSNDEDPREKDSPQNECSLCHTVYKNNDQLKLHMKLVHVDAANIEELVTHDSTVTTTTQPSLWFQCRYCPESFNTSKKLTLHMNTHDKHDKTDHSCKDCPKSESFTYSSKKSLWVHRYKKHPKVADASYCDICSKVFFDKTELFHHTSLAHKGSKGEEIASANGGEFNEMHCATDALFSMLDSSDTTHKVKHKTAEETVYQCDMCPKTFYILNALQVHRGWHFRSPDGRKVRDPNDTWQPDQLPPSKMKRMSHSHRSVHPLPATKVMSTEKNSPTCPYCQSTFASSNNLKRHIVEVHKRIEARPVTTNNESFIEKFRECTACSLKFNTTVEWVNHKLTHARVQKPSKDLEWCCEICGKVFTRKERLLQHIASHVISKDHDDADVDVDPVSDMDGRNMFHDIDEQKGSIRVRKDFQSNHAVEIKPDEIFIREVEEEEIHDSEDEIDDDEEEELDENDEEDYERTTNDAEKKEQHSCELCQVHFGSANALRQHVTEHFVNGGFGENIQLSQQSKKHRASTDSTSSSGSSDRSSSGENNSSDT